MQGWVDLYKHEGVVLKHNWVGTLASLVSLQAGELALCTANAGVPDRLFKRHAWPWKSESAKDGYVKDSIDSRLKVSKSLSI